MSFEGLLLAPHELLHVLAFKLIRKRYGYRLGDKRVSPVEPLTKGEHLFTLALPLVVWGVVTVVVYSALFAVTAIWMWSHPDRALPPLWHVGLGLTCTTIPLTYVFSCWLDVIKIWRLLSEEPSNPASQPKNQGVGDHAERQGE